MKLISDLNVNNNKILNACIESLDSTPENDNGQNNGRFWLEKTTKTEGGNNVDQYGLKIFLPNETTAATLLDNKTWGDHTSESDINLRTLKINGNVGSISTETGTLVVTGGVGISGTLNADSISGAVWNDYAEYREADGEILPGHCVTEIGDGRVKKTAKRLERLPLLVSDTFGFSIGRINDNDVPVAVCGRVLAFTDKPLSHFQIGDWVCAGKDGKVSKMNFFEKIFFADRRVGIVSSFPQQETWGSGNVSTKNRIWIRV